MDTVIRIFLSALVIAWFLMFAGFLGVCVAFITNERREDRRYHERQRANDRVASDFYHWESEYIDWRRQVSRHPSQEEQT